jgi:hypothetical protein
MEIGAICYWRERSFIMDNAVIQDTVPGSISVSESVSDAKPKPGVTTAARIEAILAGAKRLRENPLFHDYVREVEECHRANNTVPDADRWQSTFWTRR